MMAPNKEAWKNDILKDRPIHPSTHIKDAMAAVDTAVPTNASMHMPPRLFKNLQMKQMMKHFAATLLCCTNIALPQ